MVPRRGATLLRDLLELGRPIRAFGSGDAVGAILAERNGFEAVWASGLAISTAHGVPDASIVTMSELLHAASMMVSRTGLPIIADCDSGFGDVNTMARAVADYERIGAAAVCFEDKRFPKRNSFLDNGQHLQSPAEFAAMLETAISARSADLVIIARLESLIAGETVQQALDRAHLYQEVGADMILVHSRARTAEEVLRFAEEWRRSGGRSPLAAIPTTYPEATVQELHATGYVLVVYANQGLRASIRAMDWVAAKISATGSSVHIEREIATVMEVFALVGTETIEERHRAFDAAMRRLEQA